VYWQNKVSALRPQRLNFRGADKVILGQAAYGMRYEVNGAGLISEGDVRVMVFLVGKVDDRVHEGGGVIVVLKAKRTHQLAILDFPSGDLVE
jgi:hypothetical protein